MRARTRSFTRDHATTAITTSTSSAPARNTAKAAEATKLDLPISLTCDHTAIRGRRAGTPGTHSTGPDRDLAHHSPGPTTYVDGRSAKIHPGIQGPRSRPGQAQSRAQPTPAHYGTAGRADPPGHSRCLGTGPTTHSPRIPRGAHWAAGRRDIPGHSSCHGSGPAMPGPYTSPMGRRAGERGLRAIPARPRHIPAAPAHSLRAARPGQTGRGGRPDL